MSTTGLSGTAVTVSQAPPRFGRSSMLGHIHIRAGGWMAAILTGITEYCMLNIVERFENAPSYKP